jgi:uncharacterized membrane protein SirB2
MSTGLIEFYPQIKSAHIACVLASGSLFAIRGAAVLSGARWPLALPVRWLSYAIDTTLLTAALMLLTILPWSTFSNGWLVTKLILIVVYVVLATSALRSARTLQARAGFYVAALLTFGFVISIALAHHPLGIFLPWFS